MWRPQFYHLVAVLHGADVGVGSEKDVLELRLLLVHLLDGHRLALLVVELVDVGEDIVNLLLGDALFVGTVRRARTILGGAVL